MFAYVGCRTTKERNARGRGIEVYEVDEAGEWTRIQLVEGLVNPSYLCLDRSGEFLYSVHGDHSEVSSFSIDGKSGRLAKLGTVSTCGTNPVHLSVDRTNRWLFVANLQTGNVVVLPRHQDGSLGEVAWNYTIAGRVEGGVSHPHQVAQDETGDYLLVSCQGRAQGFGQVDVFRIDHETGELERTSLARSRAIAEPRHLAFHPSNRWAFGVNEKDYTVTTYAFDAVSGGLRPIRIVSTLPETCVEDGWASGIVVTGDGGLVIVSNRSHDSLTSFAIDRQTGRLSLRDCVSSGGEQPRFIGLAPAGHTVWAANELSDSLVEFSYDLETGMLTRTGRVVETPSPTCLVFK